MEHITILNFLTETLGNFQSMFFSDHVDYYGNDSSFE